MATKRKKVKATKVPKYIYGALISGATSLISGSINKSKALDAEREQALIQRSVNRSTDLDLLEEYPQEGYNVQSYYQKKGGRLKTTGSYNTKGGRLQGVSSDMELAVGKSHKQGGIELSKNGKPIAEIEGGETIKDGIKVYSDELEITKGVTYADAAAKLARRKGKIEEGVKVGNKIDRNTAERQLAILDQEEDALFNTQEASKIGETTSHIAYGGTMKKKQDGGKLAPYLDNIVNLGLTATAPRVSAPNYQRPTKLVTDVNINPELGDISRAVDATSKSILQNTSSSASARNELAGVRLQGARAKSNVRAHKTNVETSLINANRLNTQQVTASNLAKADKFNERTLARDSDVQAQLSANAANLAGDYIDKRNFESKEAFQKEQLDVFRKYSVKGTSERVDLNNPTEVKKLLNDPVYAKEQLERYKNNPRELSRLKSLLRFTNLAVPNLD